MVKLIVDLDEKIYGNLKIEKAKRNKSSLNETAEEILSEALNG